MPTVPVNQDVDEDRDGCCWPGKDDLTAAPPDETNATRDEDLPIANGGVE